MKKHLSTLLTIALLATLAKAEEFRYEANWDSIRSRYECPEWFRDAKFGIFVIWGAFSVPGQGSEKYGKNMYTGGNPEHIGMSTKEYHLENYGPLSEFGYKDFFPMFKMEKYDPAAWADLFKRSGARYVVPMADYHDNYAMYASKLTRWNVVDVGPKKDIMRMLEKAVREEGLKFGISSHLAMSKAYYSKKDPTADTSNPEFLDLYLPQGEKGKPPPKEFLDKWWGRTTEAIDMYEPDLLWFDFGIDKGGFESLHAPMLAYYYNKGLEWNKGVVFNAKNMNKTQRINGKFFHDKSVKSYPEDLIVLDLERGRMSGINDQPWQTDTSVGKQSWGYIKNERYKTSDYLIDELIDITSKNGCLLLAIGPKADGTIDPNSTAILEGMGAWLERNGESIFATRPWKVFGEGPTEVAAGHHSEHENADNVAADFRFTKKGEVLYAISLGWPDNGMFMIKSLAKGNPHESRPVRTVEFVSGGTLNWEQTNEGLVIQTLDGKPCEAAYAFRIRFADK